MTPKKTRRKVAVQKSIFTRYLAITMGIVVLSFIMLGTVMMAFFSQYWKNEKRDLLTQNAASIAEMSNAFLSKTSEDTYQLQTTVLKTFIDAFSTSIDADIFITDLEGNILLGNYPNSKLSQPQSVPQQTVSLAAQGMYEGRNTFGGLYRSPSFIIGVPMYAGENKDMCVGAVFAATSVSTVSAFQGEALQMFLVAAAAALGITFIVVGAFAYRLVQPLRQMSAAARTFGGGDFSVRVPVTSADELGQLALSFNNMANSLSNSEGTRRSFIANVSHELKTPMTTIAGFIDGILDGTIPKEQEDKYLHIVSDEVKRLSRLVKSMLDLSRIDSGEMQLHPTNFDITNTIVTTLLTFEQKIDEKGIEIRGLEEARPQMVLGDQDLLHQVVYNLIENTGPGIAPEDLPMIFERFYKTDKSRSRDKNGMGLGLYIVRTILKLHGGDIAVSSAVGQFCRFEFYIPKPQEAPKLKDTGSFKLKDASYRSKAKEKKATKAEKQEREEPERSKEDDGRPEE